MNNDNFTYLDGGYDNTNIDAGTDAKIDAEPQQKAKKPIKYEPIKFENVKNVQIDGKNLSDYKMNAIGTGRIEDINVNKPFEDGTLKSNGKKWDTGPSKFSKNFGKVGKAAIGALALGGLTTAIFSDGGRQTNAQLYGQQPRY